MSYSQSNPNEAIRESAGPTDIALTEAEERFCNLEKAFEELVAKAHPYIRSHAEPATIGKPPSTLEDVASPCRDRVRRLTRRAAELRERVSSVTSCLE